MTTVTRVLGLKNQLIRSSDLERITTLVDEVSEINFHSYGLLSAYANVVASEGTGQGEIFNQTLIDQVMAISRFPDKHNPNIPDALAKASEQYWAGPLINLRQERVASDLLHIDVMKQSRVQIVTAFKNCLELATPSHQRLAIQQLYNLTSKEAKLVCANLTTSAEKRLELALEAHTKRDKRIALRKRDELDVAIRQGLDSAADLELQFRKLERLVAQNQSAAKAAPELAYASLMEDNMLDKPRVRQAGLVGPLLSLQTIFERELVLLPATQSQADQLNYRFNLLRRLEANESPKLFNLVPVTSYRRTFVFLSKDPFANLVPPLKGAGRKRKPDYDDMNDLMPLLFKKEGFKKMLKDKPLCFGDTIRTDGIQLQVQLVDAANRQAKLRKMAARKETNQLKKEAKEKGETYVKPAKEKPPPSTKLPKRKSELVAALVLPEGAKLVGCDPGIKNIGGFVAEDDISSPYTITTASYYHDTGIKGRQKQLAHAEKTERELNPAFATATAAVANVSTKTAHFQTLITALHIRGAHFRTLYGFYGSEGIARQRFQNYQGQQRVMEKLVLRTLPTKDHILVVGDADFGSGRKGLPAGVAGKFVKKVQQERTVIFADEFRSSMLDSDTHDVMYHPPKEMAVSKYGKCYLRRVFGLYQSSSSGYSRMWNRDCNAARNILLNFRRKYETGAVPAPFQRGTKHDELSKPAACSYKYSAKAGGGFSRWREPLILADPEATEIDL